jgi:hypothetical protein
MMKGTMFVSRVPVVERVLIFREYASETCTKVEKFFNARCEALPSACPVAWSKYSNYCSLNSVFGVMSRGVTKASGICAVNRRKSQWHWWDLLVLASEFPSNCGLGHPGLNIAL